MDEIFAAIAEPTRRHLLERLRTRGPLSLSQLAEPFSISRQAVTKHLDVLRKCGLIRVQRSGRQRLHALQPEPLRDVESWLKPYADEWDRRLVRLKRHVEEKS